MKPATNMPLPLRGAALFVAMSGILPAVHADSLFVAEAKNGTVTVRESSSSMLDLIDQTIRRDGEFVVFAGTNFDANITFLGVPNSIKVNLDASGTSATLSIPAINFSRSFSGASEEEIKEKIRSFLKKEGSEIVAQLRKAVRRTSAASVTDGNPDANTASAARTVFFNHGLSAPASLAFAGYQPPSDPKRSAASVTARTADLTIAGKSYRANQYRINANLVSLRLSEKVRLELPVNADYVNIEGTEIFGGGAYLALPIQWVSMDDENIAGYRLTPVAGAQSRASFDAVSGAIVGFGGLVSSLDLRIAPNLVVSLINQATYHQGVPLKLYGFTFESDIEQIIAKNGVRLLTRLGKNAYISGYYVHTEFLNEAAIDSYHTIGLGAQSRLSRTQSLMVNLESDMAEGYSSAALRLEWNRAW